MTTGTNSPAVTATPTTADLPAPVGVSSGGASGPPGRGATAASVPNPEFDHLEDWLAEYFLPMFRRTLGGEYRWCRQWWRHGEAISRLGALWHSWEVLRIQPGTGIATWYRDHLDHQLPLLLGARGPFYQCSEEIHREPHQPAADPAPDGWWDRPTEPTVEDDHRPAAHTGEDDLETGEGMVTSDGTT
jgi:hypothetical protein